jgi:hypothetical protein
VLPSGGNHEEGIDMLAVHVRDIIKLAMLVGSAYGRSKAIT